MRNSSLPILRNCPRAQLGLFLSLMVVSAGTFLFALPSLIMPILTPDAVEYVATAYNWTEGRGFLNPIAFSYYLRDLHPPLPAFAVRPPMLSLLLIPPLALGADLTTLHLLHILWGSLVAVLGVTVARRFMSLPAATLFGIAAFLSPYWRQAAQQLMPEATAVAVLLAAILLSQRAVSSHRGALLLGLVTLVGWLTRPNLGIIVVAVVLAAVVDLGPHRALRCGPLWTYVVSFALFHRIVVIAFSASEGLAPYAFSGVFLELVSHEGESMRLLFSAYDRQYSGAFQFLQENGEAFIRQIEGNLRGCLSVAFFKPAHHYVGWLAPPALVYGLLKGGSGSMTRRFVVFAGVGITVVTLGVFSFDAKRFMLPGVVCLWLLGGMLLDDLSGVIGRRLYRKGFVSSPSRAPVAITGVFLVAVSALWSVENLGSQITHLHTEWRRFRGLGSWGARPAGPWSATPSTMCRYLDRDVLVASPDPWSFYFWCGNAGMLIPYDLRDLEGVHRYIDDQAPGFIVIHRHGALSAFSRSPRLQRLATIEDLVLYRVYNAPPESRPWDAPPPLASRSSGWRL